MKFARFARLACRCALLWDASIRRTAVEIWSDIGAARDIGIADAHDEAALVAAHPPSDEKCGVCLGNLHAHGLHAARFERGRHSDIHDLAYQRLNRLVDESAVIVRLVLEVEHSASCRFFASQKGGGGLESASCKQSVHIVILSVRQVVWGAT